MSLALSLLAHHEIDNRLQVVLIDLVAAACHVGCLFVESVRGLLVQVVNYLHDVSNIHLPVAVGVALQNDLEGRRTADGCIILSMSY